MKYLKKHLISTIFLLIGIVLIIVTPLLPKSFRGYFVNSTGYLFDAQLILFLMGIGLIIILLTLLILFLRRSKSTIDVQKKLTASTDITKLFFILTLLGCIAGCFQIVDTLISANGAPQQCAGMAMAIAYAAVPYCLARAIQEILKK